MVSERSDDLGGRARSAPIAAVTAAAVAAIALAGCAGIGPRRFPLRDPLWLDPDTGALAGTPADYYSGANADTVDQIFLRPLSRTLAVPLAEEAWNVNSMDEVPNSSWFTNRIGFHPMTAAEVARGACGDAPSLDPSRGPWLVTGAKTDGIHPGFQIRAPDGRRYLLKLDGESQPLQSTTGDVVGARLYHAAGYFTPCNEIVFVSDQILQLDPAARTTTDVGDKIPMTPAHLEKLLGQAWRRPDGLVRVMASRLLPGEPIGPFRYEGTRTDDPNDVVPHQKRRELRGSMLLAAWIHHGDVREQNTLDMVVSESGRRFVRHHLLDWSDAIGSRWRWDRFSRRMGSGATGYLDLDHVLVDIVSLGLYPRPWNHIMPSPVGESFAYFSADGFVPGRWRANYVNPAFEEMTARDALWAARIVARFSDEHLRAVTAEAKLEDARTADHLVQAFAARRDAILRHYLGRGSPLGDFTLERRPGDDRQSLCFVDLELRTRVGDPATTLYKVRLRGGENLELTLGWRHLYPPEAGDRARSCVALPIARRRPHDLAAAGAADDDPLRYAVLEIYSHQVPARKAAALVALHLYDLGPRRGFRLVGIERPATVGDPP
jgi:hypothetical protein